MVDLCAAPGSWSQVLSKKLRYCNVAAEHQRVQPLSMVQPMVMQRALCNVTC